MHGKGTYNWPDGNKYMGEYKKGKKHGWGVYSWASGKEYEGTWKNGVHDGFGFMKVHSKSEKKKGYWKDGEFVKWVEEQEESTADDVPKRTKSE